MSKKHKQRTLKYIQVHNFKLMGPCFSWKVLFITVVPWFLDNQDAGFTEINPIRKSGCCSAIFTAAAV